MRELLQVFLRRLDGGQSAACGSGALRHVRSASGSQPRRCCAPCSKRLPSINPAAARSTRRSATSTSPAWTRRRSTRGAPLPLKPDLDRIAALKNKKDLADLVALLMRRGHPTFFNFSSEQDPKDSTQEIAGDGSGWARAARSRLLFQDRQEIRGSESSLCGARREDVRVAGIERLPMPPRRRKW